MNRWRLIDWMDAYRRGRHRRKGGDIREGDKCPIKYFSSFCRGEGKGEFDVGFFL